MNSAQQRKHIEKLFAAAKVAEKAMREAERKYGWAQATKADNLPTELAAYQAARDEWYKLISDPVYVEAKRLELSYIAPKPKRGKSSDEIDGYLAR